MNKPIDFRSYAKSSKRHYSEFVDTSLSLPWQVSEIIRTGCLFPQHDIMYRVVSLYLILPSALLEVCPILLLTGKQGSGKSQIGILASKLHNATIFGANTPYAAIRNSLTENRLKTFSLPKAKHDDLPNCVTLERNIFLIWDDIDPSLLIEQKPLYRLLKNGYNRSTSEIEISSETRGKNLKFNCFSPKLMSSVTNLTLDARFRELGRRTLVVETKPLEELNIDARERNSSHVDYLPEQLCNFDSYGWDGFNKAYDEFWANEELLRDYGNCLVEVDSLLKGLNQHLSANQASLVKEMIAIGNISTQFNSVREGVELFLEFFSLVKSSPKIESDKLRSQLEIFLGKELLQIEAFNKKYGSKLAYTVKASLVSSYLDSLVSLGELGTKPDAVEIKNLLLDLGWFLDGVTYRKQS